MEAREAARWLLAQYKGPLLCREYHPAAGTALIVLMEAAGRSSLTNEERRTLRVLASPDGSLGALAQVILLEDSLRGQPEAARLPAYAQLLDANSAYLRAMFLIVQRCQVPPALRHHWEAGPRYEKTARPTYEGWALDHYWRFRAMSFPSLRDELRFLWDRIVEYAARLVREPRLPEGIEEQRREEARAAVARLIDLGDQVVPFIVAQRDFILRAGDARDPRASDGHLFELWVMRARPRPEYIPIVQQLINSSNQKVRATALATLDAIGNDDPYPFKAYFIYDLAPPPG